MTATISVVIPTIGRTSLDAAVKSCVGAHEILVEPNQDGDRGYKARTQGIARATGSHLAFLDDDDEYLPGAIQTMQQQACDVPVVFKMRHRMLGELWKDPELRYGNVGSPMLLIPNIPDLLGKWEPHVLGRGGDYTFAAGCVKNMGGPVFHDQVICQVRPNPHRQGPTVTVVTPWFNHRDLSSDYIDALQDELTDSDDLIVVDNASEVPLHFKGVRSDTNLGFSAGSNLGLRQATTDAVLFLNNDIFANQDGWLNQLRAALEPGVLVGARLRTDVHGAVDGTPLPYLDGWCLAGMRDDLLELDGFDEGFQEPSYYGDNDLCLRARAAGMVLREVRVGLTHKESRTTDDNPPAGTAAAAVNRGLFQARARELLAA